MNQIFPTLAIMTSLLLVMTPMRAQDVAFDAPEQAHWHAASASWYVSSLGGGVSLERDGYGWISRLDPEGKVLDARWVAGLDAPTGIDSDGNRLVVADRDAVIEIDVAAGAIVNRVALPQADFPNDVAIGPDGSVYVSDFMGHRIFRIPAGGKPGILVEGGAVRYPNGLVVDGERLLVATWGEMTDPATFAVATPGTVLTVDLATGEVAPWGDGRAMGSFDGIVKVGDIVYGTDWLGGRLLRIEPDGSFRPVLTGFRQLADLGYRPDTRQLMMPEMSTDRVILLSLDP